MIRLEQHPSGYFVPAEGDDGELLEGDNLKTALTVSLFTRRYHPDTIGRNGWWGSKFLVAPLGSHLHLLSTAKMHLRTIRKAQLYADDATKWTVESGVLKKLDASAGRLSSTGIWIRLDGVRPDDTVWSNRWERELRTL